MVNFPNTLNAYIQQTTSNVPKIWQAAQAEAVSTIPDKLGAVTTAITKYYKDLIAISTKYHAAARDKFLADQKSLQKSPPSESDLRMQKKISDARPGSISVLSYLNSEERDRLFADCKEIAKALGVPPSNNVTGVNMTANGSLPVSEVSTDEEGIKNFKLVSQILEDKGFKFDSTTRTFGDAVYQNVYQTSGSGSGGSCGACAGSSSSSK